MNQTLMVALFVLLGAAVGYFIRQQVASRLKGKQGEKLEEEAQKARTQAQEIILEAKDKAASLIDEARQEEINNMKRANFGSGTKMKLVKKK